MQLNYVVHFKQINNEYIAIMSLIFQLNAHVQLNICVVQ